MTDNEIIKALECCLAKENCEVVSCEKCPLEKRYECTDIMFHETIDLINRQQAEIDRYKGVIKILERDVAAAKAEAVKEFAERLKEELRTLTANNGGFVPSIIDNLVNELTHQPTKIEHNSLCETETYESR